MSLLFTESWDGIGTTSASYLGKWTAAAGGTISAGNGRNGNGLRGPGSNTWRFTVASADEHATFILGAACFWTVLDEVEIFTFAADNGATEHVIIRSNAAGALEVWRGDPGGGGSAQLDVSANGVIGATTWHYIECKAILGDGTSGQVIVRVDGVEVVDTGGVDTKNAGTDTTFDSIMIEGDAGATDRVNFDDLVLMNGVDSGLAGLPNNDFLGDVFVEALFPNGNGATSGMTGSDADSTDNYLLVDETGANDGDTTYVESGVDDTKDTYAYGATSGTGGVAGVAAYTWAKRTDTDSRDIAIVSRLSTATPTEEDSADQALASTYACHRAIFEADPGGSVWTRANVDAGEWGVKSRPT